MLYMYMYTPRRRRIHTRTSDRIIFSIVVRGLKIREPRSVDRGLEHRWYGLRGNQSRIMGYSRFIVKIIFSFY